MLSVNNRYVTWSGYTWSRESSPICGPSALPTSFSHTCTHAVHGPGAIQSCMHTCRCHYEANISTCARFLRTGRKKPRIFSYEGWERIENERTLSCEILKQQLSHLSKLGFAMTECVFRNSCQLLTWDDSSSPAELLTLLSHLQQMRPQVSWLWLCPIGFCIVFCVSSWLDIALWNYFEECTPKKTDYVVKTELSTNANLNSIPHRWSWGLSN